MSAQPAQWRMATSACTAAGRGDTISLTFPMPVVRFGPLVADNVRVLYLAARCLLFRGSGQWREPRGSLYSENAVRGGAGPCLQLPALNRPWAADYGTGERFVHHRKASTPSRHTQGCTYFAWSNRG